MVQFTQGATNPGLVPRHRFSAQVRAKELACEGNVGIRAAKAFATFNERNAFSLAFKPYKVERQRTGGSTAFSAQLKSLPQRLFHRFFFWSVTQAFSSIDFCFVLHSLFVRCASADANRPALRQQRIDSCKDVTHDVPSVNEV